MEKLYLKEYKPPQEDYKDHQKQEFFNNAYMNYVSDLQNDLSSSASETTGDSKAPPIKPPTASDYEDRDELTSKDASKVAKMTEPKEDVYKKFN